jgi:hypothetical protein
MITVEEVKAILGKPENTPGYAGYAGKWRTNNTRRVSWWLEAVNTAQTKLLFSLLTPNIVTNPGLPFVAKVTTVLGGTSQSTTTLASLSMASENGSRDSKPVLVTEISVGRNNKEKR